jgi:two-component system cell cycle response regulator PopA
MPSTARVLIVGEASGGGNPALPETLRKHGFASRSVDLASGLQACCQEDRPDVVVLDLLAAHAEQHFDKFIAFARHLKTESALTNIPVVAIGEEARCDEAKVTEIRNAQVDEIILGPFNEHQICGRLGALVRLNTMHEELVRRLNTSAKYGVDAPVITAPPRSVDDATVLVVGATESYPVIENTLARHATLIGALTPETALDYLTRRRFDTVIIDLDGDPQPYMELCRAVRRNSRLFNLPIVLMADPRDLNGSDMAECEGVTDIVLKPVRPRELESRIVSLISELRFRDSLRAIYKEARHMATSDGLTGLYSRGFLLEHLRSMIDDARARAGKFSLAFLDISNIEAINSEFGYVVGDRIIRQVGEMMGFLVRGEDLTARYSGGRFCVILPDTSLEPARVAVKRISGVVKCTELTTPEIDRPVKVDLICSICEFEDDAEPQQMIERVRAMMS